MSFHNMGAVKIKYPKNHRFTYDVVLSFAEEDRVFVRQVAEYLKQKGVKFYYDDYNRIESWGKDLSVYLDEIYRIDARFCVMFISGYYIKKHWSQHEQERALARSFFTVNKEYILPFKLDDVSVPGLRNTIAYLTKETYNEQQLAEVIIKKVEQDRQDRYPVLRTIHRFFSNKVQIALVILIFICISGLTLFDHLTPISVLTKRIHERSRTYLRAVCKDGSFSSSHGRGVCSHHGGVDHYIDSVIYQKTMDQSKKEAALISWIPP